MMSRRSETIPQHKQERMLRSPSRPTFALLAAFAAGGIVSAQAAAPPAGHASHPVGSVRPATQPHRIPQERRQGTFTTAQALPLHPREHPVRTEGNIASRQHDDHVIRITPGTP
jgi:hypothetical protein